ncbi:hypothetical protein CBL_03933 [Carabus blaptoides fortunei]
MATLSGPTCMFRTKSVLYRDNTHMSTYDQCVIAIDRRADRQDMLYGGAHTKPIAARLCRLHQPELGIGVASTITNTIFTNTYMCVCVCDPSAETMQFYSLIPDLGSGIKCSKLDTNMKPFIEKYINKKFYRCTLDRKDP